jgi:hypothetical protein
VALYYRRIAAEKKARKEGEKAYRPLQLMCKGPWREVEDDLYILRNLPRQLDPYII